MLALGRPWPLLGGGRLYVPKGPVVAGAAVTVVADRLSAVAAWARVAGYDTVLADAEIPAATGYPAALAARGFRPVEEIGPSRHRVATPIPAGADDDILLAEIATTTRQRCASPSGAECGSSATTRRPRRQPGRLRGTGTRAPRRGSDGGVRAVPPPPGRHR